MAEKNSTGDGHVPEDSAEDPRMNEIPVCSPRIAPRAAGMYVGQTTVGMAHALVGATLLELQFQTGADIEQLALLVTWSNVGRLIGSFIVGAIFDRLHPEMQLGLALLVSCLATMFIPFTNAYHIVAVLVAVQGLCMGYMTAGSTANCFHLWKGKTGPFLQGFFWCVSLGGALAPPMAQPFITKSCANSSVADPSTAWTSHLDEIILHGVNATSVNESGSTIMSEQDSVQCPHTTPFTDEYGLHSGVFYPYVILATLQGIASIYFAIIFSTDRCRPFRKKATVTVSSSEPTNIRSNLLLIVLTSTMLLCIIGIEMIVSTLLYTYAVKHLGWDTVSANNLSTAYWVSFAGFRALSIALSKILKPEVAQGILIAIMFPALGVMAVFSGVDPLVMWVCVPLFGIAMSSQMPNIVLIAGNFFNISARISAILMATLYAGGIILPALTGYLFENVDMQWYLYMQVVFAVIMLVIFIVIIIKGRKLTKTTIALELTEEIQSLNAIAMEDIH